MHKVHCAICSKVEGKEKFLILKFNNLLKHIGCRKAKVVGLGVEVGVFYFNGKCQHVATLLWPSVGVKPNTWKK